jgi:hypothetical protein
MKETTRLQMLGEFSSQNLSWICSNCSPLRSSTLPSLQSSSRCLAKKVLLTLREIANIFTLGVRTTSSVINLLVSSRDSFHFHSQQNGCVPQDELFLLAKTRIYAQHNRFSHCNQQCRKEEHDKICIQMRK